MILENIENIKIESNQTIDEIEIDKVKNFWNISGIQEPIPSDLVETLKTYGCCTILLDLENNPYEENYIAIGYLNQNLKPTSTIFDDFNVNTHWLYQPAIMIGIDGMGYSYVYTYKHGIFGLYLISDSDLDADELKFLAPTLTEFVKHGGELHPIY